MTLALAFLHGTTFYAYAKHRQTLIFFLKKKTENFPCSVSRSVWCWQKANNRYTVCMQGSIRCIFYIIISRRIFPFCGYCVFYKANMYVRYDFSAWHRLENECYSNGSVCTACVRSVQMQFIEFIENVSLCWWYANFFSISLSHLTWRYYIFFLFVFYFYQPIRIYFRKFIFFFIVACLNARLSPELMIVVTKSHKNGKSENER